MSTEENNKALVCRFYEEVFNKKNLAGLDAFVDPQIIEHALPPGLPTGSEGTKQFIGMYLTAFPDLHLAAEDMIAEGDEVAARFTMRGIHRGEFMGIPSTGKQVTMTGIQIVRIADGRIAENWVNLDALGMLQQLGVLPAMH
ncbi:MAG TPA: ester cyclase [Ktedonobacteraceae bacterium]|nr:ester cyclase [Ktedonobacteraceae bacterium]